MDLLFNRLRCLQSHAPWQRYRGRSNLRRHEWPYRRERFSSLARLAGQTRFHGKKKRRGVGGGGGGGFSRGRQTVQRSPREKALFKGGREVLKGAKEGVSPSIKKCF